MQDPDAGRRPGSSRSADVPGLTSLSKSGFDNDEITYIDEESSSAPVTPGSPVSNPQQQVYEPQQQNNEYEPVQQQPNQLLLHAHQQPVVSLSCITRTSNTSIGAVGVGVDTSLSVVSLESSSRGVDTLLSVVSLEASSFPTPASLSGLSVAGPTSIGSLASPETPGSPTIHMSVVNTGQGVRRASVVMIERVDEEQENLTSFDNHVFV
jgi:hypothetical protein